MRDLLCELLLARSRKLKVSVSLLKMRDITGTEPFCSCFFEEFIMENLKIYEINSKYIDYLALYAPHLFRNSQPNQQNTRKYIGVVLQIKNMNYFAPLSSFKAKHARMKENIDFIKIKNYAVINLNNMFPVPPGECRYVNTSSIRDVNYKALLLAEYRYIKSIQEKIRKNAHNLYKIKCKDENGSALSKRCNDFILLEGACERYLRW